MGRGIPFLDALLEHELDIVSCEVCGRMWLSSNPDRSLSTHRWGKHRLRTAICPGCGKPLIRRKNRFDCENPGCSIVKISKGRILKAAI